MKTTPIKKKEDIEMLKKYFYEQQKYRDYALLVMGINTGLRIGDLLQLKWKNVYHFTTNMYLRHIYITEKKTHKAICVAINASCINALEMLRQQGNIQKDEEYIFTPKSAHNKPISRNRAYHIIKDAAMKNNIEGNISCHSLRKTLGYHAWKAGAPPTLIMNVYNHSNIEITKRYLGIDQDDRDNLYDSLNL